MKKRDDKRKRLKGNTTEEEISLSTKDFEIIAEAPKTKSDQRVPFAPITRITYSPEQADPYIGKVILGRYEVQQLIGVGGMGRVYKAYQHTVDRFVAIKILPSGPGMDEQIAQRFHQEARAASRLSHPNTITVHDFGQIEDGSLYIVMEFLTGKTLEYVIQEKPSVARVLRIVLQICGSLAEAHQQGIIHRDLKPPNIIVSAIGDDKDWVKVVDFGIAKLVNTRASLTVDGTVSGTPEYMSPEQVQGEAVDARSDIYSLGLLMYELLTGDPVVASNTPLACMYAHIHDKPRPFSEAKTHHSVPPGLESVVLKMLAKEPTDRFKSISKLMPILSDLLLDEVTKSKKTEQPKNEGVRVEVKAPQKEIKREQEPETPMTQSSDELQMLEGLAKLYEKRGEPEQATETYRKIASRYIDINAYEEATKVLKAALALSPNDEGSRQMIETCFAILDQRRTKKVSERDSRPTPIPPPGIEVPTPRASEVSDKKMLATRLELAVQDRHFQQALSLIRKTLAEDPSNGIAIEYAGHIYETVDDNVLDQDEIIWLKALLGKATDKATKRPAYIDTRSFGRRHNLITIKAGKFESAYGGTFKIDAFGLQKYPVTNGDYSAFIKATGELPPTHWLGNEPPQNIINLPVVGVTLKDARNYAEWSSMRLPTTAEWEAAARLPDGRKLPWGNEWKSEFCHGPDNGAIGPREVGKYRGGGSYYGCLDMLGNVWEWTENHEDTEPPEPGYYWVMGGSFRHACFKNGKIARTNVSEHGAYPYLGFRCARGLKRQKK